MKLIPKVEVVELPATSEMASTASLVSGYNYAGISLLKTVLLGIGTPFEVVKFCRFRSINSSSGSSLCEILIGCENVSIKCMD